MNDDELDAALKSEVVSHADVYDLLHTLDSYQGEGKRSRSMYDSGLVIKRLLYEYRRLRDERDRYRRDLGYALGLTEKSSYDLAKENP